MKKNVIIGAVLLCGLAGLIVGLRYCEAKTPGSGFADQGNTASKPAGNALRRFENLRNADPHKVFMEIYLTPIEFYGKVVDQYGAPVPNANVSLVVFDDPEGESASKMKIASDNGGRFSVKGLKGSSLGVSVTKNGHLDLPPSESGKPTSSKNIGYGLLEDKGARFKDPNKPTIFILHKLGPLEPLVYIDDQLWHLPVDGTPRMIALDTKKGIGPHQIEFRFMSGWSQLPPGKRFGKLFDWKLEMRVPGGGFCRNKSDYTFEAPESGYEERILIDYPKNAPDWRKFAKRRYFVRFSDGTRARIRFDISADSDRSPLLMTSWMNLKPGSRNLTSEKKDTTIMWDE